MRGQHHTIGLVELKQEHGGRRSQSVIKRCHQAQPVVPLCGCLHRSGEDDDDAPYQREADDCILLVSHEVDPDAYGQEHACGHTGHDLVWARLRL